MSRMLKAALGYAAHGWPVFSVVPRDKRPMTPAGFKDATTDPTEIGRWWGEAPEANIGFCPGRAGLLVVDVDGPDGRQAAAGLGLLSEPTLAVLTGRPDGGMHLYYRHPGGTIGNAPLGPHLDVRADDGYVLLPPSVHPSGAAYRWDKAEILALPSTVAMPTAGGRRAPAPAPSPTVIPEGGRNQALTSLAGTLRRRGLDAAEIAAALEAVNASRCRPPLTEAEVQAIATSVARYDPAAPLATAPAPEPLAVRNARIGEDAQASLDAPSDATSWGWPELDRQFGRVVPGWLYVVGARPSNGKTTLLLNVLSRLWERQIRALYFGTEMAANQLLKKWAAIRLGLSELQVFERQLHPEHRDALGAEMKRLLASNAVTFCEAARLTLAKLVEEIAWACAPDGGLQPQVVILDHLHRVSQDREELEHLAAELKTVAQERHVALLVAAQLNRDEQEKVFDLYYPPTMGRYKGSSAIEENADVGLGLYRPLQKGITRAQFKAAARGEVELQSLAKPNTLAIVCTKHRYSGGALSRTVELTITQSRLESPNIEGFAGTANEELELDPVPF